MSIFDICVFLIVVSFLIVIYAVFKYVYVRVNKYTIMCEHIRKGYMYKISSESGYLYKQAHMKYLSTWKSYSESPEKADKWLVKNVLSDSVEVTHILNALKYNTGVNSELSSMFDDVLKQVNSIFAYDIRCYICDTYIKWMNDVFPVEYRLDVLYLSSAGRRHKCKPWYWTFSDIVRLSGRQKKPENTYVRKTPRRDNLPDDFVRSPLIQTHKPLSKSNTVDTDKILAEVSVRPKQVTRTVHVQTSTVQQNQFAQQNNQENVIDTRTYRSNFWTSPSDNKTMSQRMLPVNYDRLSSACIGYIYKSDPFTVADFEKSIYNIGVQNPCCYAILNLKTGKYYIGKGNSARWCVGSHLHGCDVSDVNTIDYAIAHNNDPVLLRIFPLSECGYIDLSDMVEHLISAYGCLYPNGYNYASIDRRMFPVIDSVLSSECIDWIRCNNPMTIDEFNSSVYNEGAKPGCYVILDLKTNKYYVGQAGSLKRRMKDHLTGKNRKDLTNIDHAIFDDKDPILIRICPFFECNYDDLNDMERCLIQAYDSAQPNGYNKTKGNKVK